jgi:hypothetical protein
MKKENTPKKKRQEQTRQRRNKEMFNLSKQRNVQLEQAKQEVSLRKPNRRSASTIQRATKLQSC